MLLLADAAWSRCTSPLSASPRCTTGGWTAVRRPLCRVRVPWSSAVRTGVGRRDAALAVTCRALRRVPAARRSARACRPSATSSRSISTRSSCESCVALEDGDSVLVAAPTGAGKTIVAEFAVFLAMRDPAREGLLHGADEGAVEPEVQRARRRCTDPSRSACSPATPREPARPRGRDDHRGAAQHALRRQRPAHRPDVRRDGRGALPRRPLPRCRVGGGHHPPPAGGADGLAQRDRLERRGVRRLAAGGAGRHRCHRLRGAPGAARAARAHAQPSSSTSSTRRTRPRAERRA